MDFQECNHPLQKLLVNVINILRYDSHESMGKNNPIRFVVV